ncbi:MAG: YXWGXW repeat-containing protein [Betaproteobacteria bacterium]|uniref:YXWGXW repeat-containing protein n=1 Tax=Candidatus Proximibacter danicus TaxID=2954365 RepID=A0A9D7K1F2_9PROT|nr:YXWGXW repeat-containing protein [Candidatus Proximibacter danicus]MBK9447654.1 YXWGXW repeat-containing protein [Betaproteobacteria bacterium]
MKTGRLLTAGVISVAALLAGCAVSPSAGPRYVERHEYYEPVRVAPPPPYVEHVGHPPVIGHVWISGYWNWGGARYAWVPGRWDAPRSGHHWVPHRWEKNGDHWRQQGGHWERGGNVQRNTVVVRQPERSTHNDRSMHNDRDGRRDDHQWSAPAPRFERNDAARGGHEVRSQPERSVRPPAAPEARLSPRNDVSRPDVSERQPRAEAPVRNERREMSRDSAREPARNGSESRPGREREARPERGNERSREDGRNAGRDSSRERGA